MLVVSRVQRPALQFLAERMGCVTESGLGIGQSILGDATQLHRDSEQKSGIVFEVSLPQTPGSSRILREAQTGKEALRSWQNDP